MPWTYSVCNTMFFYEADDGIRGRDVTGVQACALPISGSVVRVGVDASLFGGGQGNTLTINSGLTNRSEERRVGKECRFRWWLADKGGTMVKAWEGWSNMMLAGRGLGRSKEALDKQERT